MTTVARVAAQAKINLFLRILAREESGYHALETLFARLDLVDDVTVRVGDAGRSIDCRGADLGPAESNLAYRAATTYAEVKGWPNGFAIEIDKRIPVGGGLGGGSADAGAVLRALNAMAPAPIAPDALMAVAGLLGADVPFMVAESPLAWAWGRGDRLLELTPLPPREVALICFPFAVSSAAAYGWLAESRRSRPARASASRLTLAELESWEGVNALAGNDFESEVSRRHPPIGVVLAAARSQRTLVAGLSGSGSTVFVMSTSGADPGAISLPPDASLLRTRTARSVEDVHVIG